MACVLASTMALISASDGPPLHAVRITANKGMIVPIQFFYSSGYEPASGESIGQRAGRGSRAQVGLVVDRGLAGE